ncbi:hypothetical protein GMOD_00000715 [Pyrenophora seminiperda CCB06]|uniref:Uncharacterized protein n=1 Tax=Pyrenophora seminiperda CCB06 TaxID=1302712 RepID=A0A3M7M803_9PLEO|nr:hypothetical protein GMOD_00000715 [Pyrenophora seminiperda CCB06]
MDDAAVANGTLSDGDSLAQLFIRRQNIATNTAFTAELRESCMHVLDTAINREVGPAMVAGEPVVRILQRVVTEIGKLYHEHTLRIAAEAAAKDDSAKGKSAEVEENVQPTDREEDSPDEDIEMSGTEISVNDSIAVANEEISDDESDWEPVSESEGKRGPGQSKRAYWQERRKRLKATLSARQKRKWLSYVAPLETGATDPRRRLYGSFASSSRPSKLTLASPDSMPATKGNSEVASPSPGRSQPSESSSVSRDSMEANKGSSEEASPFSSSPQPKNATSASPSSTGSTRESSEAASPVALKANRELTAKSPSTPSKRAAKPTRTTKKPTVNSKVNKPSLIVKLSIALPNAEETIPTKTPRPTRRKASSKFKSQEIVVDTESEDDITTKQHVVAASTKAANAATTTTATAATQTSQKHTIIFYCYPDSSFSPSFRLRSNPAELSRPPILSSSPSVPSSASSSASASASPDPAPAQTLFQLPPPPPPPTQATSNTHAFPAFPSMSPSLLPLFHRGTHIALVNILEDHDEDPDLTLQEIIEELEATRPIVRDREHKAVMRGGNWVYAALKGLVEEGKKEGSDDGEEGDEDEDGEDGEDEEDERADVEMCVSYLQTWIDMEWRRLHG